MKINYPSFLLLKLAVVVIALIVGCFGFGRSYFQWQKAEASASGPSPSHTNAPGEDNCTACHTSFPVNSGTGSVQISGLPATWMPGQQIALTVTTAKSDAVIYGFQLTAVDSQGRQAGTFSFPFTNPAQVQTINGVVLGNTRQYIEHTVSGTAPVVFGTKTWNVIWTAPSQRVGTVGFYAAGNAANSDGTTSGDYIYTTSKSSTSVQKAPFDFDNDGKTDISIFRPGTGDWWYLRSKDGGNRAFQFGASTDKIVPGDYTGDGTTDIAFYRKSTTEWFVLRSEDFSYYSFPFGAAEDIPVPADYDGDGKTDAAVFRPSSNTWFIQNSGKNPAYTITTFGVAGDRPVPADYDGDGKADIAIYRPSVGQWWLNRSRDGGIVYTFGTGTDKCVPGDYTGDSKADVAFWRPSTGFWYILRSEDSSYYSFPLGNSTDTPSPGDYDGDGKFDAAVFRSSVSTWYIKNSGGIPDTTITQFGVPSDLSVPNAYVVP